MGRFAQKAVAAAVVVAAVAAPAAAEEIGNPVEGHVLALKICSFCHVVAADQEFPPTLRKPAPSFRAIANRRGTTGESLRRFLATTHTTIAEPANMPNPRMTDEQIVDIVAYILTLRSGQAGARGQEPGGRVPGHPPSQ